MTLRMAVFLLPFSPVLSKDGISERAFLPEGEGLFFCGREWKECQERLK